MIRVMFAGLVLVAALIVANQPAKAEWLFSADLWDWVTYDVDEPAYALTWGPPVRPSCFWKQGIFGRWKMICP